MGNQQNNFKFMTFFELMFKNLHRLFLVNAMFFVTLSAWLVAFYFIGEVTGYKQPILLSCALITCFPFYSGVISVTRDIVLEKENISVFKTYFSSLKENGWRFLVYGVLVFLAFWMSFFSIAFYLNLAKAVSSLFYGILFICMLVIIAVLFTFFYVPVMTITYDLKMRHILKNSFLMAFGEFKSNLLTTLGLVCLTAILFSVSIFCKSVLALEILILCVALLIVPTIPALIINFGVFNSMNDVMMQSAKKVDGVNKKIDDNFSKIKKQEEKVQDDFSEINIEQLSDTDEYIFYNGKMIKQSVLLAKIKEKESEKNEK